MEKTRTKRIKKHIAIITAIAMMMTLTPTVAFAVSRPGRVTISSLAQVSSTSARVKWKAVSGAKGYEVWRKSNTASKYTRVRVTTARSCLNTGMITGKTYYYKVRAYKLSGSKKIYSKSYSVIKSIQLVPSLEITMPTRLGSGGTLTYTIKNPKGNERLFLNINSKNDSIYGAPENMTAIIVPNAMDAYNDSAADVTKVAETFAIQSVRLESTGTTTSVFTGNTKHKFPIDPGDTATITLRYIYGSPMPATFNPQTDIFITRITYSDTGYSIISNNGNTYVSGEIN
ncbi:MAG TPA: fibronectin type III domain-containing protein [Anaerovoracaceae bacterium]|nr:fibronectin type III domain-containing protein [Anaerovoracaceae bacterium]